MQEQIYDAAQKLKYDEYYFAVKRHAEIDAFILSIKNGKGGVTVPFTNLELMQKQLSQ